MMKKTGIVLAASVLLASVYAETISVNFSPYPVVSNDGERVDSGESAPVGLSGVASIDGSGWNNIQLRPGSSGGRGTTFTDNSQGGNHIDLTDSTGSDSGIDMTSSGDFYANLANVSAPNQAATGDGGLMQGFLNLNSSETISLSGLSTWAPNGYKVYAFFDIGSFTRAYGVSMNDGSLNQIFWTADSSGTDADSNDDGVIEWLETTATTESSAVADANHAVFGTFTGDTLTISGDAEGTKRATLSGFQIVALASPPLPEALNVNLGLALTDANAVDSDEFSVTGLTGAKMIKGTGWNNVMLKASGSGAPSDFTAATQGGSHLDLIDSTGTDAGIDMTSSGSFYSNFGNVSSPNQATTGDGGLLQSYLLLDSSESVALSGLATWAPNGYRVRAFFDMGSFNRTYGITMDDGGAPQSFWTADSGETDSDPDDDGVMTWIETTATTEEAAVADANHALFGPFTGDTLTISAESPNGRAALSGLQIIPNSDPLATITSFTASPDFFTSGEPVTLAWDVTDADSVSIDQGVGVVSASGTLELSPTASTTWTLTAVRGGTQIAAQTRATMSKGPIDVYLLGGQSNMKGNARSSKLPAELLSIPEILYYNGSLGSLGAPGSTFGPEIGIGERMRDLCPGQPIALIKYAASGTSLELNWRPGADASDTDNWGAKFTAFVNRVNDGIAALEADGWQPVIHGMCWQQGEQDAKDGLNVKESDTSADDYGANLAHFIGRVREQFASHAAPAGIRFAPGQVLPYAPAGGDVEARFPGRSLVRQAILDADEDSGAPLSVANTRAIPTNEIDHPSHAQEIDGYRDTDEVHQNAAALLAIGRSMAYAMLDLDPQSYADWAASYRLEGGFDADADGDGLSNGSEYMFHGDPTISTNTPRPELGFVDEEGVVVPVCTWTRNLEAMDATPETEFSLDLVDWISYPAVFTSSIRGPDGTATLSFRSPLPLDAANPHGFFRIKAISAE